MSNKSHVGMTSYTCRGCYEEYEGNEILLDCRLQDSLDRVNHMGLGGLCPECEKLKDNYIFLIEVSNAQDESQTHLKEEEAQLTGRTIKMRKCVAEVCFEDIDFSKPNTEMGAFFAYITEEVFNYIQSRYEDIEQGDTSCETNEA